MSLRWLPGEALRSGIGLWVPFALSVAVGVTMTLTTLLVAGHQTAERQQILETLELSGSRTIQVTDTQSQNIITPSTVRSLEVVSAVEHVIALSAPVDMSNADLPGDPPVVPVWGVSGRIADTVTIIRGRAPREGEAIVSEAALRRLGLTAPVGQLVSVDGATVSVVGEYRSPGFPDLAAGALEPATARQQLASLQVITGDYRDAARVQTLALSLIPAVDPTTLSIVSPVAAARLQEKVLDRLGASSAITTAITLASGSAFIAMIALADTLARRREIGRRRALGISRPTLLLLTIVRSLIPGIIGVAIGALAGFLVSLRLGIVLPLDFVAGTGILAIVATALFATLPAVFAARQDPVRALRTP